MGFRELARDHSALIGEHNRLAEAHNRLFEECAQTRRLLVQLVGAHNYFVGASLWGRLRWALTGRISVPAPTPPPNDSAAPASRRSNVSVTRVED